MNVFGWVVLAAAAVAAVADGWSVARGRDTVAQPSTPAVPVLLGLWAWLGHADRTTPGRWLLVALLAWLVGAVLLVAHDLSTRRLAAGTAAFLAGHLAVLAGVLALPAGTARWPAVALVLVLGAGALAFVARRARGQGPALVPVATSYGVVLVLVAALAWARGAVLPAAGLTLLAVSDLLRVTDRLDRRPGRRALPLAVMVSSHAAAALVSVGLVRPDLVG